MSTLPLQQRKFSDGPTRDIIFGRDVLTRLSPPGKTITPVSGVKIADLHPQAEPFRAFAEFNMAAAAKQTRIAEELISRGADVCARNRRGAEPLHYAVDGGPDSPVWDPNERTAIIAKLIRAGADRTLLIKAGSLHCTARARPRRDQNPQPTVRFCPPRVAYCRRLSGIVGMNFDTGWAP